MIHTQFSFGNIECIYYLKYDPLIEGEEICQNYDSAIFYSISSLETGLRGIDLGHRLIVSSCDSMKNDLSTSNLKQFSSLSPGKPTDQHYRPPKGGYYSLFSSKFSPMD